MCQKIPYKASELEATVKDIMIEIGVASPIHFNKISKGHFDNTHREFSHHLPLKWNINHTIDRDKSDKCEIICAFGKENE